MEAVFVIVGGGIAGVTCVETLSLLEPEKTIILLSESSLIKTVTNLQAVTKTLQNFDIAEVRPQEFNAKHSNVTVIHDSLLEIDDINSNIKTKNGRLINYVFLCICTGAEPKLIPQANEFNEIIGIRDTDSIQTLIKKMSQAKKVVIIGNGGIATELVYKISNAEVHWVIKDKHITATFVDAGAAHFFVPFLNSRDSSHPVVLKRMKYGEESSTNPGAALGPDWYRHLTISGFDSNETTSVKVHYETEIDNILKLENLEYPVEVILSNGDSIACDLIISATGVNPRINFVTKNPINISPQGGILVNEYMQTNLKNVYAAGDVCEANWNLAKHWFQMKLWTQARQMGCYAAKSIVGHMNKEEVLQDFCFEIFAHSTRLFNYKVILLGLFNGQKLGSNYEILLRMTRGHEYIKFILENNKLQGAVLIGDTDLEEMAENLILNQIDLSPYGDEILNPDIDIEDYFD